MVALFSGVSVARTLSSSSESTLRHCAAVILQEYSREREGERTFAVLSFELVTNHVRSVLICRSVMRPE